MKPTKKETISFIDKTIAALNVLKTCMFQLTPEKNPEEEHFSDKSIPGVHVIKDIPIAMSLIDSKGSIKDWNKAFETVFYIHPPYLNKNIKDIINTKNFSDLFDAIAEGISPGGKYNHEIDSEKSNILLVLPLPENDKGRDILCILEAHENAENKHKLLVEKANDGIIIIQNGFLKFFNQKVINTTGYDSDELYKRPFLDYVHPEDMAKVFEKHQERLAGKELEHIYPIRILAKNGAEIWTEVNAVPINWNGNPAVLGIIRDLTIQRRLEEELAQARKMEALGTLAGGIAHNFNNILSAIIGYTELGIADYDTSPRGRHRQEQVLKSATRAKEMIKKILIFSLKNMEDKKNVDLSGLVTSAIERIKIKKPDRVIIEFTKDKTYNDTILASPEQIEESIYQIFKNAINSFEENPGTIKAQIEPISACMIEAPSRPLTHSDRYLKLSIADNGCGIPPNIINRIFEPYFTTMDTGKGVGLGLPFVHGIIISHNGHINVKSEPSMGSVFTIYLPAAV